MKVVLKKYNALFNRLPNIRTLCSALLYALILVINIKPQDPSLIEFLYLETYNITLVYAIVNMVLFSKEIISPKTGDIFSIEFIETIIICIVSAILIVLLFVIRKRPDLYPIGITLIKISAALIALISILISIAKKSSLKPFNHDYTTDKKNTM